MSDITSKVAHVKRAGQTRWHQCHWIGCKRQVPPAMWGCREHWFKLPKHVRDAIWAAYRIGQEESGEVSEAYLHAARAAEDWIKEHYGNGDTGKRV